jgi:segregation and condensation protein A
VSLEQLTAFGELHVRWTGSAQGDVVIIDEFDDAAPAAQETT